MTHAGDVRFITPITAGRRGKRKTRGSLCAYITSWLIPQEPKALPGFSPTVERSDKDGYYLPCGDTHRPAALVPVVW